MDYYAQVHETLSVDYFFLPALDEPLSRSHNFYFFKQFDQTTKGWPIDSSSLLEEAKS